LYSELADLVFYVPDLNSLGAGLLDDRAIETFPACSALDDHVLSLLMELSFDELFIGLAVGGYLITGLLADSSC
jgi:hypothetical protein